MLAAMLFLGPKSGAPKPQSTRPDAVFGASGDWGRWATRTPRASRGGLDVSGGSAKPRSLPPSVQPAPVFRSGFQVAIPLLNLRTGPRQRPQ